MIGGILMIMPLDQVRVGRWACVIEVDTDRQLQQRLCDFGLVPGALLRRCYTSPGGDLSAIELSDTHLALRTTDLHYIHVRA